MCNFSPGIVSSTALKIQHVKVFETLGDENNVNFGDVYRCLKCENRAGFVVFLRVYHLKDENTETCVSPTFSLVHRSREISRFFDLSFLTLIFFF